jgi:glycosyltransferase involved in cell wall biosynthesis
MNILFLNNYNYLRGGAETVFFQEAALMERFGHSTHTFCRRHPNNLPSKYDKYFPLEMDTESVKPTMSGLKTLSQFFYSKEAKNGMAQMMQDIQIDVAHAHNIYSRLTSSVLDVLRKKNIPVLMTLHDYKLICPNYKLMHKGGICVDCKKNKYYMAIVNKCHKDNLIASTIVALEAYFNYFLKSYEKNVRFFISPSKFLKNKLIEFGWPQERIKFIPNFLSAGDFDPKYLPGNYFLYLGRLSSEKGIKTLIQAFSDVKNADVQLKIAGEGPLEKDLKVNAASDSRVSFLGYLTGAPLAEITRNALAVIVPSEWFENAPLSVLEAMAYGKPVIGARIGGIPEMIDHGNNGFLFESGNADALAHAMRTLLDMDQEAVIELGRSARGKVQVEYNADLHYDKLINLYRKVCSTG